MTLLQLIAHLKETFETHGEMEVKIHCYAVKPEEVDLSDIKVDPEAKTITFT